MATFLEEEDSDNLRIMIQELLNIDKGLTVKEIDFLEDVNENWKGNLTEKQGQWIEKIYKRVFG